MPSLEESLRHFWMPGIHEIRGGTPEALRDWLLRRNFVFTQVYGRDNFIIRVINPTEAKTAVAFGSTEMASAAFETMLGIGTVSNLPKSAAWIVIRAYYAAFFAAHSLLRAFGTTCTQLESSQTAGLNRVADAFGLLPINGFESGHYTANYDSLSDEIHFRKVNAAKKGSHEILWDVFANLLRRASNHLMGVSATYNDVALQLSEMDDLLRQAGQNDGSWLSHIRNQTNYRLEYSLWYPYTDTTTSGQELTRILRRWRSTPGKLFPINKSTQIILHTWLCTIIVSLSHAVALDIENHAFGHRCFHTNRSLALTRLVNS
jgi:hypothetical protein